MNQEAELMQQIVADPDNDIPRLIFADWAEEHGDEDRAEFIRTQCEYAQMDVWDDRYQALESRASELLAKNRNKWMKLMKGTFVRVYEFRRGFLDTIVLNGKKNLHLGGEILNSFPTIRGIKVNSIGPAFDAFIESPWITKLKHLNVTSNGMGMRRSERLIRSPLLRNLEGLNLQSNKLREKSIALVFEPDLLPSLKTLSIAAADLSNASNLRNVFREEKLRQIEWLSIAHVDWPSNTIPAVCEVLGSCDDLALRFLTTAGYGEFYLADDRRPLAPDSFQDFYDSSTFRNLSHFDYCGNISNSNLERLCNHPNTNLDSLAVWNLNREQLEILNEGQTIWNRLKFLRTYIEQGIGSLAEYENLRRLDCLAAIVHRHGQMQHLSDALKIPVIDRDTTPVPGWFYDW